MRTLNPTSQPFAPAPIAPPIAPAIAPARNIAISTRSYRSSSTDWNPSYSQYSSGYSSPPTPDGSPTNGSPTSKSSVGRFGTSWMTTFPKKSPPSSPHPAVTNPHLIVGDDHTPSHRARSPSMPTLLPSEERTKTWTPTKPTPAQAQNGSPFNKRQFFNPFSDDNDDLPSDAVNRSLSGLSISDRPRPAYAPSPTGAPINAGIFSPTSDRDASVGTPPLDEIGEGRNVYLPGISSYVTDDALRTVAQRYGRVVSVKVERDLSYISQDVRDMLPDAGMSVATRCYAFVMFDSPSAARAFMAGLTAKGIACQYGKETPHLKQKALEDPHSSNLYVAEIPLDAKDEDMRRLFHPGIISSLRFLTDDHGNRRGTAMVRLQSRAQAEEAIRRLDLKVTMRGCTKALQVRIADSEYQKQFKRSHMHARSEGAASVASVPTPRGRSLAAQVFGLQNQILVERENPEDNDIYALLPDDAPQPTRPAPPEAFVPRGLVPPGHVSSQWRTPRSPSAYTLVVPRY